MSGKRSLGVAAVLLVIAAATIWGSSRMAWVHAQVQDQLSPARAMDVAGASWAPALSVIPLVFLAAIAASVALKKWARVLVAVVVAAAAVGAAFPAFSVLTQEPDVGYLERVLKLVARDVVVEVDQRPMGPAVAIIGAVVAVAAAVLLLRSRSGGGMGSRYSAPAARRVEFEQRVFDDAAAQKASERDLWDALDSGDDPTQGTQTDPKKLEG